MASQLVSASGASASSPTSGERLINFCVCRRVPISLVLFAGLILLDLAVFRSRPRDVLDWTNPLAAGGAFLVFWGLLVRTWAAGTLRKQRELATTGPYAHVRHPLYFGSFLMMIGFGTLIHDPITLWVVAGPIAWIYWQAIKSEERQIARLFPKKWPVYAAAVPRFIPW